MHIPNPWDCSDSEVADCSDYKPDENPETAIIPAAAAAAAGAIPNSRGRPIALVNTNRRGRGRPRTRIHQELALAAAPPAPVPAAGVAAPLPQQLLCADPSVAAFCCRMPPQPAGSVQSIIREHATSGRDIPHSQLLSSTVSRAFCVELPRPIQPFTSEVLSLGYAANSSSFVRDMFTLLGAIVFFSSRLLAESALAWVRELVDSNQIELLVVFSSFTSDETPLKMSIKKVTKLDSATDPNDGTASAGPARAESPPGSGGHFVERSPDT